MEFIAQWNGKASLLKFNVIFYFTKNGCESLFPRSFFKVYPLCLYVISGLKNLTNLEVLSLGYNYFDGPIPIEGDLYLLHLQDYQYGHHNFYSEKCLMNSREEYNYSYYSHHLVLQTFVFSVLRNEEFAGA